MVGTHEPWKDMYKDDPRIWHAIFEMVVADFADLEEHGIDFGSDGMMYPIIIGNKGDWSYLVSWLHWPSENYFLCNLLLYNTFVHV